MAYQYQMYTLHHHSMYDMASMLQKSRRADIQKAGYAAYSELFEATTPICGSGLIVSAQDCYDHHQGDYRAEVADDQAQCRKERLRQGSTCGKSNRLRARHGRIEMPVMWPATHECCKVAFEESEIEMSISPCSLGDEGIPDWVFDVHTYRGRQNGKTEFDMGEDEQKALTPHQLGRFFFDYGIGQTMMRSGLHLKGV